MGAEIARTSCAGLLLGNKSVIYDGSATILGWAELLPCSHVMANRNHYPYPYNKALQHFQKFVLEQLTLCLVEVHVKHFHFDVELSFDQVGFFTCVSKTWHCDFVCEIII